MKLSDGAEYERLTWRDVFTVPDGAEPPTAADQAALDDYLKVFAKPKSEDGHARCIGCGAQMRSGIEGFLLAGAEGNATWKWSIAHGECHCSRCGYPARAYHYDIGGTGEDALIKRLSLTLQYHPDGVQQSQVSRVLSPGEEEKEHGEYARVDGRS